MVVFIRDVSKARVGLDMTYDVSNPHMWVVQYLWHTIHAHRVMTELRKSDFRQYTYMYTSVVDRIFEHIATKVDVEVLKAKLKVNNNILYKQEKFIKRVKLSLDFIQDKLGMVKRLQ